MISAETLGEYHAQRPGNKDITFGPVLPQEHIKLKKSYHDLVEQTKYRYNVLVEQTEYKYHVLVKLANLSC